MNQIGQSVAPQLERVLDDVLAGRVQLWELHPALRGWYLAAWEAGRASLEPALLDAEYERDRLFERLHNPGRKFTDMVSRRIDQAAAKHEAEPDPVKFYTAVITAATQPRKVA